jgi:hypothetical protein
VAWKVSIVMTPWLEWRDGEGEALLRPPVRSRAAGVGLTGARPEMSRIVPVTLFGPIQESGELVPSSLPAQWVYPKRGVDEHAPQRSFVPFPFRCSLRRYLDRHPLGLDVLSDGRGEFHRGKSNALSRRYAKKKAPRLGA